MDLATLKDWLGYHLLFTNFTELISIVKEVTASEESQVNYNLQQSFDDVEFKISKIKRSEKIKTMASL